jgi:AsmA protein
MKKPLLIAGACLGVLGIGGALAPWPVAGETLRRVVTAQLASSGFEVTLAHGGQFTLLPIPRIEMTTVEIAGRGGQVKVTADAVRGSLRLLPLVAGRVELADLTLVKPAIEAPGAMASAFGTGLLGVSGNEAASASEGSSTFGPLDFHRIVVLDGSVRTRSPDGILTVPLSSVNGVLTSAGPGSPMDLSISLRWHGEGIELTGSGLTYTAGAAGVATPLRIKIVSDLLTASLDGRSTGGLNSQTEGDLKLRTPDANRLAAWLGTDFPIMIPGGVEASGLLRIQPGNLALSAAKLSLPSGRYDGVLTLRNGGERLSLDGTLATDHLDLDPALARILPLHAADGSWSREAFAGEALPHGEIDLRISAGRLSAGRLTLDNAALSIMSRNGRLDANLSNAEAYRGTLKARLAVSPGPRGVEAKLTGSYEKVDSAAATLALGGSRRFSGLASGSFSLEGGGESPLALMQSLEGRLGMYIRQGEIAGINLPDVLKRIERRPLNALDVKGGRTVIESGGLNAKVSHGVVDLTDAAFVAPGLRIGLTGQVVLGERQINLSGVALTAEPAPGQDQVGLPFDIVGSFDDPQVVPDAKSLIRRSSAAAPFFDRRKVTTPAGASEPTPAIEPSAAP